MNPTSTQVVRPAGAGHETLYVLVLCALILSVAASVVLWRGEKSESQSLASHQLDARRDLSAGEQGIYADLRVTLDEIQLLRAESQNLPSPEDLAGEGFAPFVQDPSSVSRGGHTWQLHEQAYLGLSQNPQVAGSFLMLVDAENASQVDIWLNRGPSPTLPDKLGEPQLIAAGWQQVVAQFDAGVTRQHRH